MEPVVGLFVGPVVGRLLNEVLDVIDETIKCKSYLERLKSTLEARTPQIEGINPLDEVVRNLQNSNTQKLKKMLEEGRDLAMKCSRMSSINYLGRCQNSKRLRKWDESMVRFLQVDIQAEIWFNTRPRRDGGGGSDTRIRSMGSCAVPEIPDFIVGLEIPLRDLKTKLLRDEVRVLGLNGLGGCGKTTLAAMLCNDEQVKEKFKENIFFLTASSSPNLILQRLVEQIDVTHRVPDFDNDEDAINHLRYVLTQKAKPVLLVLEDVWDESVVQKFVFKIKGFQMLITSRTVFQTPDFNYSLKMLSFQDALTLFRRLAFPHGGNENNAPNEDLLNKTVRGCQGHPMLLEVIASLLRRKSERNWENVEKDLSQGSILESHKNILDCLAISLQFLDHNVRECFLDLGCFPEGQRIPASTLIDIWVEIYKLDNENSAYDNLDKLSDRNLVNLVESTRKEAGELDGDLNKLIVVQHDLLRELAIYENRKESKRLIIDRRKGLAESWREEAHRHPGARLASIHTDEASSTSWCDMELPEVEVLILNFWATKYTLPPFMEKMGKLKVLIITNHGRNHAKLRDFSRRSYMSRLKRLRLEKVSVPSLNEIMIPLENLQKISLKMCEVGQAFKNCTINIPHMLPNLIEININYCNDLVELPPGICDIVHLQKLSITNCHKLSALPEGIGGMTHLEVLRLHACTGLLELPDSLRRLQKIKFLDIAECLNIKKLPEGMGDLHGLEKLDMRKCQEVKELPISVRYLGHLKHVICDEGTARLWKSLQEDQNHFSKLNIEVRKEDINLDWLGVDLRSLNLH